MNNMNDLNSMNQNPTGQMPTDIYNQPPIGSGIPPTTQPVVENTQVYNQTVQPTMDPNQANNAYAQPTMDPNQAYNAYAQPTMDPNQAYNAYAQPTMDPNQAYNAYAQQPVNNNMMGNTQQQTTPGAAAPSPNQTVTPKEKPVEEELLECFVGNNYKDICDSPFNIGAFFFGIAYLFYRKMLLIALGIMLIIIFLPIGLSYFTPLSLETTPSIVALAENILLAFFVNKIYINHAKKKVSKIQKKNPGKSVEDLKRICGRKGGTSIGAAILGTIGSLLIIFIIYALLLFATMLSVLYSFFGINGMKVSTTTNGEDDAYAVLFTEDVESNSKSVFNVQPPEIFEAIGNTGDDYEFSYKASGTNYGPLSCTFSIDTMTDIKETPEEILSSYQKNFPDRSPSQAEKVIYNNIEWYRMSTRYKDSTIIYYLAKSNNDLYRVEYLISDSGPPECQNYLEPTMYGITRK